MVGSYPVDTSVYGVQDMAGNIRDWTRTSWTNDGCVIDGARLKDAHAEPNEADSNRVNRSGSWGSSTTNAPLADRYDYVSGVRSFALGFRLSRALL